MSAGIPTVVGSNLLKSVRHEGDLRGRGLEDEFYKVGTGVAFDIEFCGNQVFEQQDIFAGDMTLIGPRMNRDALRTEALAVNSKALNIGQIAAARIAQGSHLIDIHTQPGHKIFLSLLQMRTMTSAFPNGCTP